MMDPAREKSEAEKPILPMNDSPAKGPASTGTPSTTTGPHPPPSPLSGCYLLVVLPEPHFAQHKDLILNRVAKGFLSWDKDNCHVDLEKELQALVVQSPEGEEARNGERLIQYATENLVTEILIHPQTNTLLQCIRNLLASFTKHRHIIHAGYTFGENGSWILQDGTFSLADFLDAFNEHDVQRVLRAYENSVTVDINCAEIGEWSTQRFSKEPCTRTCRVRLNPDDVLTAGVPAITSFTKYIEQYLVPQTLDQLMQPSDVVGNIRFSHPTLYVFPGGQGDAALFGINGFNMLVDGGFARKSCFWDFTRHLDRLDAVLLTRINNNNVAGMSSVLAKKRDMQVYPQIGHFFCNLAERKHSNSPDGDKDLDPLILSLTELGQEMMLNLKHINLRPHPCYRDPEPINLYHKVGHGTLDMYVLSPSKESREVREFLAKWNSGDWKLFAGSHKKDNSLTFPIQNMISICALLVWQPANPEDTITRILFPGSTPQHKIFEGMERLRHLEFLKHPTCSAKSISPSASLVTLKDKPAKQKLGLIDREMKRAVEIKKQKREIEKIEKVDVKPITKKSIVVENKKVDADVEENKTSKTIIETKEVKETKKIEKELKKTEVTKTEKTATKEIKTKIERKKEEDTTKAKELPMRFITGKTGKTEVISEKKIKEKPAPKKDSRANGGISSKPEQPKVPISKPTPKPIAKSQPAAPKSAKDANNRKVVEQKNIERMSIAASATRSSAAKNKTPAPATAPVGSEKKPVPRRPKPAAVSPSKTRIIGGSPVKSAKSTPTASVKSDKDGVLRRIKSGAGDSSVASTPSAIEVDSLTKFTDKCLTEKSEDMSLDSIESKVLADLKEERKVVEEIEAVLQKAERIEGARKAERLDGEDEVTGEITAEKKDITEDMTEDDVTADIDEVPRKSPIRKASHEQMTEEEDEYLIIEKEEGYTEDSAISGEHEHKHFLDAVESEKEKAKEEMPEKSKIHLEESEESEGENDEESGGEEKEVADEKGMTEDREKSDDIPEKKLTVGETHEMKLEDKEKSPIAEYKEQLKEEMKGIIMSAAEIVQKTEDKDDSGKKDSEDLKEISSLSPEKLDSSEKKTDTDAKPEIDQKTKEKLEESQEKISTVESGQTTTAPTLPEDERIPVDVVKPIAVEKPVVDDKKAEISKPKEIVPLAVEPSEVKPDMRAFNLRQGAHVLQRDIVKTPDEVADLPVHEEVDPILYKMEDFEKPKDDKIPTVQNVKDVVEKDQKGVLGFFGKVADKFEKGMDKLTGKTRRDSEKDVDEKSSKSGSPKEERRQQPILEGIVSKEEPGAIPKIGESSLKKESPEKSIVDAPKIEQKDIEKVQKLPEDKEDLEDVEALLEEASKKFKDVKDSIHDSLESLDEKVAEEEFNRASELAEIVKNEVKGTLEEVVGKLENIKPDFESLKEGDKAHFTIPKAESSEEEDDDDDDIPFKNVRGAVKDVGGVLAGTAGIIIEDKPKDVVEIVKKVAEVLKEDDFLSDEILFKDEQTAGIEQSVQKTSAEPLEVSEEPCLKKTVDNTPILSSPINETLDKKHAVEAMCEDLMDDYSPVHTRAKRSLENLNQETDLDVLEVGLEEVCHKVHIPEPKDEKRGSMEIEPSEISFDHNIAPDTAELVIVSPDSQPPSPKFTSDKVQSKSDEKDEIETIISEYENIMDIIEEMVFVKNKKITFEIIEIIRIIKRVPKEQILHIIEELSLKKKVPWNKMVVDGVLKDETHDVEEGAKDEGIGSPLVDEQLKSEIETEIMDGYVSKNKKLNRTIIEEIHIRRKVPIKIVIEIIEKIVITKKVSRQSIADIPDNIWNELKLSGGTEEESEGEEEEEDEMINEIISEIGTEIVNDYVTKGKKLTKNIIEEIHIRRKVPIRIIIEIIEEIVTVRKISRQSFVDFSDVAWNEFKSSNIAEDEPEEKSDGPEKKESHDDFELIDEKIKSEVRTEIVDDFVTKGKKLTKNIIEEIHIRRKIPTKYIIEIIEEIVTIRKVSRQSIVDFSDAAWNEFKTNEEPEKKSTEVEEEKIHPDSEIVDDEISLQIESEIINEYVSKNKKLTRSNIEEIHVKRKIPKSVIVEIIERITIIKKISRQSFVDISETDWNELRILDHHSEHSGTDEEDIEEDDELLQGFVQIPAESSMNKFHRESDKLDDFEAVEQEYKISGAKAIIEKGKIGIEEAFDTDNSDIIEADDVLKPKIELDKSTKPSPLTSEILHKVDEKERKPSLVGLEEKDHEKPEDIVRFSEDIEDKDAQIVRRMIVTATSEDGGEETEVCPTGSITFTKTISPDDSLRSSPVKTAADKDSLQSTTSTMETDSLNKTLSHIHDSETLDDSIEEKPLGLSFDKKDIKEVETKSSEIDKLDDYSPAESMIGSPSLSAAKDLPKAGIFEIKEDIKIKDTTHTEEEKILDIKKSPEVSESSKSQSPIIAQKDEIELSLDKSTSSSITSILQEEKEPDILQKPEGTKSYENLIEKKEEEKLMIGAESSNIETSRKKSLVDVEKEKPLTSEIEILSSSEAEDKKKEEKEKTTDHKSPTPIDTSTRMESPIHQDQIDKMEKADVAPDSNKGSPITNEKTSEEKGSLAIRKESVSGIIDTPELAIKISDKKLEDEAKEDIIDRITPSHIAESVESLASDVKSSASSPGISPVKKESIIPGKIDDSKTDEIGVSTLIHEISSLTKESIAPVKDGSKIEEVEQPSHEISSVRKESIIPDKEDDFKAGGIKSSASSRATSPVRKESIIPEKDDSKASGIKSSTSSRTTSPVRKESIIPEKDDSKPDKIGSPASPCATSPGRKESIISEKDDSKPKEIKSSASSRTTSPVRKESIVPDKKDDSKPKEIKSSASSRATSPVRKESIIPEKADSKPKEIKSSASSRTTSPVRKESIVPDKKDDSKPEEIKSSASSRATSPVRKESIIPEKADSKPKEIKSSASSRTTSPVRKESTIHEKDDFKAGGIESSTSSQVTSPVRKDSIIPEKDDSKPKEIESSASSRTTSPVRKESIVPEKKDNSKTEEIKSSTSSRATSPEKKGSIILERLDDFKSGDIKSSTSPSPISPDIKDNIVQEKHDDKKTEDFKSSASLQLSPIRKDSISPEKTDDPKAGESKSSGSPVRKDSIPEKNDSKPEEVKSSASSHATSPVRKESIIPEKVDDSKTVEVKSSASPRETSPVRKESIIPEKSDSKPEEVKSSASSHATSPVRKESIIPEKVDDSKTVEVKSSASSRATSPVRKESIIPEKSDSKPEEVKSSASSHATSPVRKESIIPEKVDDSKTVEVKSSASSRAASPVRKESIIPEKSDSKPGEVKSSASSHATSPVRKESIIPEKVDDSKTVEVKSSASSRATSPVRKESIVPEKNDSKPEEVKSSASSHATSPVRKESIIPEKVDDSKDDEAKLTPSTREVSPIRKESFTETKLDDGHIIGKIGDATPSIPLAENDKSSVFINPLEISLSRKSSLAQDEKIQTPRLSVDLKPEDLEVDKKSSSLIPGSVKSSVSPGDISPAEEDDLIHDKMSISHIPRKSIDLKVGDLHGDQKSPSSITQNIKSPASPQDISPIRKESLAHDEIQPLSHAPRKSVDLKLDEPQDTKKSPSPIAESIKSSESPRDISPLRKDSVFSDMKDKLDDAKFPASPQNISPERRESIHHDEKIKHDDEQIEDKLHDSISPRPSMGDIKSSIPSTIAKESIVDEAVEKPDDEKRSDIKSLQSHLGDSEARKDSIVSDEKEALRKLSVGSSHDSAVEDKKLHSPLVGKVESTISSRDPSPETKKTAVFNRFDDTYDAKLSSPVAAGDKSSVFVNPLDIHLAKKDSTTSHETVLTSQTTSLSVDLNIKDVDDDNKATSPIAESVKSAASPAGISPVEKESVAHDKTIPTSQTPRQSVDLKIDDLLDTKKTGGPIDEIAKSSASPSDISQVQGESSAHDEKIEISKTPRQSVDLKIDNLDIDGKIPSPIAEGAKSSTHITSPVRKESLADCSIEGKLPSSIAESVKSSALPHDITVAGKENFSHDGIIHADVAVEKITSPIVGKVEIPTSPADISPVKEDKSHSSSQSQRQSVDLKLGDVHVDEKSQSTIAENVKSSSSPLDISPARKESLVHDDPLQSIQIPRQSVDLKLDETHFDQKTASQTTESVVSDVHLILDDKITKDEKISSPKEIPPIRKDSSAFEEKINKFEGEIDKKSPASPQDISLDKKDNSAHDDEILVRQSPRQSIDLKKHDLLVGEKSADPTIESVKPSAPPSDISPRKESFSHDAPIPTSQVPSKSAVMKIDNLHFDEKSPIAESEKSSEIPPAAGGAIDSEYKTKSSDEFTKSQELISGRKESMSHEVKEQSTTVPFSSGFGDKLEDIHGMFEDDPDLASRSRSSSMASEFPEDRREEKFDTKSSMDMMSMSMVLNPTKEIFKTAELDAAFQKISSPVPSIHDDEVPSRDRSRSHSLFEGSEKTPVGRSRAASLFEDDMITKTISRKSSGLSEFPEEHLHESGSKIETIEDEFEVTVANKKDIERYIMSQYVTRKIKITMATLEEIVSLYEVPSNIVIEIISEICDTGRISKESIIDFEIDAGDQNDSAGLIKQSESTYFKRIETESYIVDEYIKKNRKISWKIIEEISVVKDLHVNLILEIIEFLILQKKISRESLLDEDIIAGHLSERKASTIKEVDEEEMEGQMREPERIKMSYSGMETGYSGESTPRSFDSPKRITKEHYDDDDDDKYESPFHKAFVGGMTEIRTTHITTLSGKSTPDVGLRTDTPDSGEFVVPDSDSFMAKSSFMTQREPEYETIVKRSDPIVIKRTIVTEEGPEYQTVVKTIEPTTIKRTVISEDDPEYETQTIIKKTIVREVIEDEDGNIVEEHKGISKSDIDEKISQMMNKSLGQSSSGRSTPDKIRESPVPRSSTGTPDSFCSSEVIRTTITKTRTISGEGEIITTTKEVTETTNERGETTVLEEKIDVKTSTAEPGAEVVSHQWIEGKHEDSEEEEEEEEDEDPLSGKSQVFHLNKSGNKEVEFSTADMSSSFYGTLPNIPQTKHGMDFKTDDGEHTFTKFTVEKRFEDSDGKVTSTSKTYKDVGDFDIDKVLKDDDDDDDEEDENKKDPLKDWGTPLKLPHPEKPEKFNLRTTPIVRNSLDMSPDSLNFDVINNWGEPLRLPSPAPGVDEASNKAMPTTPKKEKKAPRKIVAENLKNKKRSDSPAGKDKKKDQKKVQPVYLDLTYVPHHGNSYYASLEFFKRVRARYYVFSGTEPSREVYDALLDAKKTWENKNLEVTMIPTYDTDTLGYWVADNEEALAANHIDLSPSASRCTINLQDHETSCSAYRLEF